MSGVLTESVRRFCADNPVGVVATTRPDGTTRQSVVYFALEGDRVVISTESGRAKARDVGRTGRASLCVFGTAKPFPSVTIEGPARIRTDDIGRLTAAIVERIIGAPTESQSDEQLAAVDRVILDITVDRVYGASYLPDA